MADRKSQIANRKTRRGLYLVDTTGTKPTIKRIEDLDADELAQLAVRLENARIRREMDKLPNVERGVRSAERTRRNAGDGQP